MNINFSSSPFFEKYALVEPDEIRVGGFGRIHKCKNLSGEFFAIKEVPLSSEIKKLTFERETKSLKRLSHPGIVEIIDYAIIDEKGFLIMPWYESSLQSLIANNNLNPKLIKSSEILEKIVLPLTVALAYAHSKEVFHRDIKPHNVLIRDQFTPILADFGSSKILALGESLDTVVRFDSRHYTAPIPGTLAQQDLFSLGVLIVETLSRKFATSFEEVREMLNPREGSPFSVATRHLIESLIEVEPARRATNVVSVRDEISSRVESNMTAKSGQSIGWIRLTTNARSSLKPLSKLDKKLDEVINDLLAESVQHAFPESKDTEKQVNSSFWLISDQFRLLLKANQEKNGWNAVAAVMVGAEDTEYLREKSMPIENLHVTWIVGNTVPKTDGGKILNGFKVFNSRFFAWSRRDAKSGPEKNSLELERESLIRTWSSLSDAAAEIETTRFPNLKYVRAEVSGSDVTIKLAEVYEGDLETSSWQVPFPKPVVGTVSYHSLDDLVISFAREPRGKLAQTGVISPGLDYGMEVQLERQRDAIRSLDEKSTVANWLPDTLTRPENATPYTAKTPSDWKQSKLDDSKKEAVSLALGSQNICLIKGPPGTGKTSFISEYVYQEIQRNSKIRILLVSQTHVALDNAIERVEAMGITKIVRIGQEGPKIGVHSKRYLIDNQMFNWRKELELQSESFSNRLAKSQNISLSQAHIIIQLDRLESLLMELEELRRNQQNDVTRETDVLEGILSPTLISTKRIGHLEDEVEAIYSKIRSSPELNVLTMPRDCDLSICRDLKGALLGNIKFSDNFLKLIETQSRWLGKIGSSPQLEALYLKTCNVIAGTCEGFLSNQNVRDLTFDVCIIDEASKASALQALVPMVKSERQVVVGDSRQLAASEYELLNPQNAPILSKFGLSREDIDDNIFKRLERYLPESHVKSLSIQYRMKDEIGGLISNCFYDGLLKSAGPKDDFGISRIIPTVLWIDTSHSQEAYEFRSSNSYSNRFEVLLVEERLKALQSGIDKGIIKINQSYKLKVLVVCPYAAQVQQAKTVISKLQQYSFEVEFNTIDAVQGREADVVIFSTVRNNSHFNSGFLSEANWRRINVALSRARLSLIIIGSLTFWQNSNSSLSQVIDYIEKRESSAFGIWRSHD